MDNFYTDPHLFTELIDANIYCCGTVKANRKGFPQDIVIPKRQERHLARGHYQWRMSDKKLLAMSWFDKRPVYLLSTIHPPKNDDGSLPNAQRKVRNGQPIAVPCPPAHCDYQKYMGGVDLLDQLIKNFSVIRKSKKAWKKLFGYGLEVCLLDSFIIMKQVSQSPKEFVEYRLEIARELIGNRSFRKKAGRPAVRRASARDETRLNDNKHEIQVCNRRRDCVVCAKKAHEEGLSRNYRYKTTIVCKTCSDTPLCVNKERNCWQNWHTKREYWI
jgi:hypothetical protein